MDTVNFLIGYVSDMLPGFIFVSSYAAYIILGVCCEERNKEFEKFLAENKNEILSGNGSEFRGYVYKGTTEMKRYRKCISFIIQTRVSCTSFFPAETGGAVKILCNVITLVAGWWGLPWGPIKVIETLKDNHNPGIIKVRDFYVL